MAAWNKERNLFFIRGRATGLREAAKIIAYESRSLKEAYEKTVMEADRTDGGSDPVLKKGSIMPSVKRS